MIDSVEVFFLLLSMQRECRSSHATKFRAEELILNEFGIEELALTEAKK